MQYVLEAFARDKNGEHNCDNGAVFKIEFNDLKLATKVADLLVNDWCILITDVINYMECY